MKSFTLPSPGASSSCSLRPAVLVSSGELVVCLPVVCDVCVCFVVCWICVYLCVVNKVWCCCSNDATCGLLHKRGDPPPLLHPVY
jgi:hypothetical protein